MAFILALVLGLAVAIVTGVGTAWLAVSGDRLVGAVTVGSWTAWPNTAAADADPYTLSYISRTGELSLGAGEGVAFTAAADEDGGPLTPDCVYLVEGRTPAARLWTLSVHDEDGRPMPNPTQRYSYHSGELLREPDGDFVITLSREVAPGNWLPVGDTGPYLLTLRLYDTPLATGARIGDLRMPVIRQVGCR